MNYLPSSTCGGFQVIDHHDPEKPGCGSGSGSGSGSSGGSALGPAAGGNSGSSSAQDDDPVECASGAVIDTVVDLAEPGVGDGLDLSREYDSLNNTQDGPFGYGWSANYATSLNVSFAPLDVELDQGNGDDIDFINGAAPPGVEDTLVQNADGSYTVTVDFKTVLNFNASGQLTGVSDLDGNTTALSYDASGFQAAISAASGRSITFTTDANGQITQATDQADRTVSYSYDSAGDLVSVTNPAGGVTTYTYDGNHDLLSVTDPDGDTTTNVYASGNNALTGASNLPSDPNWSVPCVSQTDPLGRTTQFSYAGDDFSDQGGTVTITHPNGEVEVQDYTDGDLVSDTLASGSPDQATWSYTYDSNNDLVTSTDPDGNTTTYSYDANGDVMKEVDPLGRVTYYDYDSLGDLLSTTDPDGNTTTNIYDQAGNLLSSTNALGETTSYTYDLLGDLLSRTDPGGNTTTNTYDSAGDLLTSTDPDGNVTTYTYNSAGEEVSMTSPGGGVTTYVYDPLGNMISSTDPDGNTSTSVYDADSRLVSQTDADGNTTTYVYDADGELTNETQPGGSTVSYAYDSNGDETSYTDANGDETSYAYDILGRVTSSTNALGETTTYAYDPSGNEISQTSPNGVTTTYSYDQDDETTGIAYSDGTTPSVDYSYNGDGQRNSMVDGTGTTTYRYNAVGEVTSVTHATPPSVTSVSPAIGPASGGTQVTISGTNFAGAVSVDFGALAASNVVVVSPTEITATSPAGSSGTVVDVTVTTAGGTSAVNSADQFAYESPGSATFTATPQPAYAGQAVSFAASADFRAGDVLAYSWDFGDGTTAAGQSVNHAYTSAGDYVVTLTVTDSQGFGPATYTQSITVYPAPTVSATASTGTAQVGQTISFAALTANYPWGDALSYSWDFGDGGTSNDENPTYAYYLPGTYQATVTVTDADGLGPIEASVQVIVTSAPALAIAANPDPAVATQEVTFSTTGGNPYPPGDTVSYAWTFGDGGSEYGGTTVNYTYFEPGTYFAQLTVSDSEGYPTQTAAVDVTVAAAPVVSITTSPNPAIPGQGVTFSADPSGFPAGDNLTYAWTFGDGAAATGAEVVHSYVSLGTYTVDLIVTDALGVAPVYANTVENVLGPTCNSPTLLYPGQAPAPASVASGNDQTTAPGANYGEPLSVYLYCADASGNLEPAPAGEPIVFAVLPLSGNGPIGSFAGEPLAFTYTDSTGLATSPPVTANSAPGTWTAAVELINVSGETVGGILPYAETISGCPADGYTLGYLSQGPAASGSGQVAEVSTQFPSPLSVQATVCAQGATLPSTITFAAYDSGPGTPGGSFAGGTTESGASYYVADVAPSGVATSSAIIADSTPGEWPAIAALDANGDVIPFALTNSATPVSVQPTVTGLMPLTGPTAGGEAVTVYGTGFVSGAEVAFGTDEATGVDVLSPIELTAIAPAEAPGVVDVTVTTAGGTSMTSSADHFTYGSPPEVTSVTPIACSLSGGTVVTVTGSGFTGASAVNFGSIPADTFAVVSDSEITAESPASAAGAVDVKVTTALGTSAASPADQIVFAPVAVTSLTPAAGPISGKVTVTLTGFGFTGATSVSFGGVKAKSFTVVSDSEITATPKAVTAPQSATVSVTSPAGTSPTLAVDQFSFDAAPTVSGVSPTDGPLAGGTFVTITGTGFTADSTVDFATTSTVSVGFVSTTTLTAVSPAGAAGAVNVTVTTPGGTSATSAADKFTYIAAPTVTALSPDAGPIAGGTQVTITGSGFATASSVSFGGALAASFTVDSSSKIVAVAPPEPAGTVIVAVTSPGGASAASTESEYTFADPPILAAISPEVGSTSGGTTVTIDGSNLSDPTEVYFGSKKAASFTSLSATELTAVSPSGTADSVVDVTVETPGGTTPVVGADEFTYADQPTVTKVKPDAGPLGGQVVVDITGTHLSDASAVDFGSTPASFTVHSATDVSAIAPPGSSGTVDITVTTPGGTSADSSADEFTYDPVPAVAQVSPNLGAPAGGTTVEVSGSGFTPATHVYFGTKKARSFTVVSNSEITAVSPSGSVDSVVDVTVASPGGTSATSPADEFTYASPPTVTEVDPDSGPASGGTTVTIHGTDFQGTQAVDFGSEAATSVIVVCATKVTAVSPAGSEGAVEVTVTTPGGTSATSSADEFTYTGSSQLRRHASAGQPGQEPALKPSPRTSRGSHIQLSPHDSVDGSALWTVSYSYDSDGNVTGITYPDGSTATYSFNADSQMATFTDGQGNTTTFSYDTNGDVVGEDYPNGIQVAMAYDPAGNLTGIADSEGADQLATYSYARNGDGLVTSATTGGVQQPEPGVPYSYSAENELTAAGSQSFSYDPAGNPTSLDGNALAYNPGDEATSEGSGSSEVQFNYDADGDRVSETPAAGAPTTYSYDGADRLIGVSSPTLSAKYTYDGDGLRLSSDTNGSIDNFAWDTETSVPELLSDGVSDYVYGPSGTPIEEVDKSSGAATYLYTDQLGSVTMEADSSGNIVGTQSYNPYGGVASTTGTWTTPFGFAGGYTDSTGLIYLINRLYDPTEGQFMSVDPLVKITQQPYTYGSNDPVHNVDPEGLATIGSFPQCYEHGIDCPPNPLIPQPNCNCNGHSHNGQYAYELCDGGWGGFIVTYYQTTCRAYFPNGTSTIISSKGYGIGFGFDLSGEWIYTNSCDSSNLKGPFSTFAVGYGPVSGTISSGGGVITVGGGGGFGLGGMWGAGIYTGVNGSAGSNCC